MSSSSKPTSKTEANSIAEVVHSPKYSNATVAWTYGPCRDAHGIGEAAEVIGDSLQRLQDGDMNGACDLLASQAAALNSIFCGLSTLAHNSMGRDMAAADRLLRLALKAQSQCSRTLEVLGGIKNPGQVAFVRQANIGGNVQVNNPPPQVENGLRSNELLEVRDGERVDSGTTGQTGRVDSNLEAVGAVNRTRQRNRQGYQRTK